MKEHNEQPPQGGIDDPVPAVDPAHALQDHAGGEALTHAHAPGIDYDHDHDDFDSSARSKTTRSGSRTTSR